MRVVLENYRCFRHAELNLSPLTVILGPNASGKTSLLRSLDPDLHLTPRDAWQRREGVVQRIRVTGTPRGEYTIEGDSPGGDLYRRGPGYLNYQLLALDPAALRSYGRLVNVTRLDQRGTQLVNLFDSLTRQQQAQLSKVFCTLVPVFGDIDREPLEGAQRLVFEDAYRKGLWYAPEEVSDGSMLTLAFLLLHYQQPQVDVLAIEDPERALHPYLIRSVIDLLRRMAEGELGGRKMHVVLTTHSPSTLEFVRPEEVRILDREDDGGVTIRELPNDAGFKDRLEVYEQSLGAAWLSGGLGGVPGS